MAAMTVAGRPAHASGRVAVDRPGRWIGGAVGAAAALLPVAAGLAIGAWHLGPDGDLSGLSGAVVVIGLLGLPIGFALGRQLMPSARSEGWRETIGTGLLFGWSAPILGAVEVLSLGLILPWDRSISFGPDGLIWLPIALPVSLVALPITLPVGVVWAISIRWIAQRTLDRHAAPASLARLGIRHALLVMLLWMLVATTFATWLRMR